MPETKLDTKTFMLPDWEIEAMKKCVEQTKKYYADFLEKPYECIGAMEAHLDIIERSLNRAKPTENETFYGGL